MPPRATPRPRYRPHPVLDRERAAQGRLVARTGRSWRAWVGLARRQGLEAPRDLKRWLKQAHGLPDRVAHGIAAEALDPAGHAYDDPRRLVEALYGGERAALRAVHEAVVDALLPLGDDVIVTACKTMVPVYRKHVFAQLRPVENAVELRLALGPAPSTDRLERCPEPGSDGRLSHRVRLNRPEQVDADLRRWLQDAYAAGAGRLVRGTSFRLPPDLARALKARAPARATWAAMTPAMRRDVAGWIASAKRPETRSRRLSTAVAKLGAGHKRVY